MELLQLIVLLILCTITSSLHAQFNVGNNVNRCTLSPNKKFLLTTHINSETKLWNMQTGQLHGTLEDDCGLFFSEDSSTIFSARGQEILPYQIAEDTIIKREPIILDKSEKWALLSYADFYSNVSYAHANKTFITLSKKFTNRDEVFISKVLENSNNTKIQVIPRKKMAIDMHIFHACTISSDTQYGAIACSKRSMEIHVINLENEQTINSYYLSVRKVSSIHFSPDKTKLILKASTFFDRYLIIILDLQTNESFWLERQCHEIFADFINDSTILMILKDGSVRYQQLTPELLEQHDVTDEREFKVLPNPYHL